MKKKQLILFDGDCLFCNGAVTFIVKRDPENLFVFAAIESQLGQAFIEYYGLADKSDTFALIDEGSCLTMSDAVLAVVKQLKGLWPLLGVFNIIPKSVRDFLYTLFGKYRYQLFGRVDQCSLTNDKLREKDVGNLSIKLWRIRSDTYSNEAGSIHSQ